MRRLVSYRWMVCGVMRSSAVISSIHRSASVLTRVSRVISSSLGVVRSRSLTFNARTAAGPVVSVASMSRVLPS